MGCYLNILNGQSMYNYFQRNNLFEKNNVYVPFNEAMCVGDIGDTDNATAYGIFSKGFIDARCKAHNVMEEEYVNHVLMPLKALFENNNSEIILWFDEDMFCQINMLTILAYLDQSGYKKDVTYNIVKGNNYKVIDSFIINPEGYLSAYKKVLFEKKLPDNIELPIIREGIINYLNYKKNDNEITDYIKKHPELDKDTLMENLLKRFSKYGLGDTQYSQLIDRCRE